MKNPEAPDLDFEGVYETFRLNTIHRHFNGTDSSLIAVFCLLELLHNLRDLVNCADGKGIHDNYAKGWWYPNNLNRIEENGFSARPEIYRYVFKRNKFMSRKAKKRVLEESKNELLKILEETGIRKFIEGILGSDHEENV